MDTLYNIILPCHHYIAFLSILLLAFATINGLLGSRSEKIFANADRKINLFALISTHTMFLLGIILLIVSPVAKLAFSDMAVAMKDATVRKMIIEHPTTNIIAVVLATIGNAKSKNGFSHGAKFKSTMIFFGLALLLILSRLPYDKIF
ncbi:MAG: hypothetical protein ACRCVT_09260 [Leadbetterella sp.]